jgi:hypothetical protein
MDRRTPEELVSLEGIGNHDCALEDVKEHSQTERRRERSGCSL